MSRILILPGDGIGPEVTAEAAAVLRAVAPDVETEQALIGGCAIDAEGAPLSDATVARAKACGLVLLGAVGGPKWDALAPALRPERGLLRIRKELGLYANLRPAAVLPALADASPLKRACVDGVDLVVVRELTGGIYYGEPRGRADIGGVRRALNTEVYDEHEVARIARVAFRTARGRKKLVTNIHKANVLEVCAFWNEIVEEVAREFPDVALEHQLVDSAAMVLLRDAPRFDVLLCPNMFGDILSDEAAMITGSLGMLPSASLGDEGRGLFEPIHGSAPDIAGQDKANPLAAILSVAMLLEHGLARAEAAASVRRAVEVVLDKGYRTGDLGAGPGHTLVGTREMGRQVREALR
ncbi:MAG: 3-isopropylmalate dehydrogenase [Deltaproteobacteria bacterium]|nr:3-isopropylmalate dehydrogenase [Deltaproteobacteria bacterium]